MCQAVDEMAADGIGDRDEHGWNKADLRPQDGKSLIAFRQDYVGSRRQQLFGLSAHRREIAVPLEDGDVEVAALLPTEFRKTREEHCKTGPPLIGI